MNAQSCIHVCGCAVIQFMRIKEMITKASIAMVV